MYSHRCVFSFLFVTLFSCVTAMPNLQDLQIQIDINQLRNTIDTRSSDYSLNNLDIDAFVRLKNVIRINNSTQEDLYIQSIITALEFESLLIKMPVMDITTIQILQLLGIIDEDGFYSVDLLTTAYSFNTNPLISSCALKGILVLLQEVTLFKDAQENLISIIKWFKNGKDYSKIPSEINAIKEFFLFLDCIALMSGDLFFLSNTWFFNCCKEMLAHKKELACIYNELNENEYWKYWLIYSSINNLFEKIEGNLEQYKKQLLTINKDTNLVHCLFEQRKN